MESGKIIVVANQKGGVAKTSTVRNLSYALAEMGKKVLVVDFDPQYNLTTSFGVLPTQAPYNTGTLITNLLLDESLPDTNEFIQKIGSVDLIPSSRSLTVAEANLLMTPDSNDYLAALLNPLRLSYYMQNGDRMYDPYMDFQIDKEAGTLRAFSYENSGIGVYNEANPDDPAYEKAINGFNSFFATWLNNIRSQGYEPVRASMMVNDEEVDVDLRPAAEAVPVVEEEQPEQLSLLSLEKSTEDLLVERVMQRGPLTAGKKEQIYEFAQTHPTGSEFTAFLKKLYGYEGFSGDEMGVKYAMFNSEGVTIEWQDEQGETQETKLSWARAAGVVQRLVDEGRYLETPVVSLPEPETDEPLEGETEPYDYSFEYGLLCRFA